MFALNSSNSPVIENSGILTDKYLTVAAAVQFTGYNGQYLRRLLRCGRLEGVRVGQAWLILLASLEAYREGMNARTDLRCGSRKMPQLSQVRIHDNPLLVKS